MSGTTRSFSTVSRPRRAVAGLVVALALAVVLVGVIGQLTMTARSAATAPQVSSTVTHDTGGSNRARLPQ